MPIYEYACTACGERIEKKQSFTDAPLETCEACGGKLRKLYSPVGVVFKGSGFYSTDAKKGKGSGSSGSGSSGSGSTDSGSSGDKKEPSSSSSTDKKSDTPSSKTSSPKKETSTS